MSPYKGVRIEKKRSDAELRRLREAWCEGMAVSLIAERFRASTETVKQLTQGLPRPVVARLKRQAPCGLTR